MEANEMAVTGFGEIAEKLRRSTVVIHARGRGSGSGVIWSSDGTIVTNAHVVRSAQVSLQLWDGREFDATVATRLALAIPSDVVRNFLSAGPSDAWLGVTVRPVRVPRSNAAHASSHTFGLMVLEVEPCSPASSASLLPGDILLGTEQEAFTL